MLRIELLGPLRSVSEPDGINVTPLSAREQVALAALALAAPSPVSVEALADELYGERETADPRNAVQAVMSRLRKALGSASAAVETTGSGYRLVDTTVDATEVIERLDVASSAADAAPLLRDAVAMWRGPTLLDLGAGPIVSGARIRLDERRCTAEDRLLELRVDAGEHEAAISDLEAAASAEPLREKRWELLMVALYRSGRQADALRAFQRARQQLGQQLGLEPGPRLTEVEQQILRHDPTLDGGLSPAADPRSSPSDTSADLPSGTVTVLFCDVEGSVRRWEAAPGPTADQISDLHSIWAGVVAENGGVVVKSTGDGLFALFERATGAIRAAAAGQRSQQASPLRVRVALHTGEVTPVDGDVRGMTVNRTARLLDVAHGDQILVSGVTAQLVGGERDDDLALRSLGTHWLRDVADPVEIFQLEGTRLPMAFPPVRSSGPSNLPRLRASLVGRDETLREVVEAVGDHPLVTLLGPGGIGKTSLALATGWQLSDHRPITFVDLAGVRDPDHVASRIAETLVPGDNDSHRSPTDRILDRLGANTDLLVIDNAEHLLEAVAAIADDVLKEELKGSLLVTSRHPLGVAGERIVEVSSLALPGTDLDLAETGRNPSVRLFLDRVAAAKPGFELPDGLLPVVAHICRRLDGIPLAIELAAGRAGILAVEDIASRLDDQLRLLRQVPATREARHRSLEAVTRWSLDQLDRPTRLLFTNLGVMAGSFDLNGAEGLSRHVGLDPDDALDALSEMVAASLVSAVRESPGRFRVLEPIRQLALAELVTAGSEDETRFAHAAWCAERAMSAHAERDLDRAPAYRAFHSDGDQFRSAMGWVVEALTRAAAGDSIAPRDELHRLAGDLSIGMSTWFLAQDPMSGMHLMRQLAGLIDRDENPFAWARVVVGWSIATATQPSMETAEISLEAVAIFDEVGDPDRAIARLAATFAQSADPDPAATRQLIDESDRLVSSDDTWTRAILDLVAMLLEARIALDDPEAADMDVAIARGQRSAEMLRRIGDDWALGAGLGELGRIHRIRGDHAAAADCFHESLDLFGDLHYHGLHYILGELGQLASLQGHFDEARSYHARARRMADDDGSAGCRAQTIIGSARSELHAGNRDDAVQLFRRAKEIQAQWSLVTYGVDDLEAELAAYETSSSD